VTQSSDQLTLVPKARARREDPWTSHLAADGVDVTKGQAIVLMAFMRGPATDDELVDRIAHYWPEIQITPQSVRSRRAELVRKKMVEDSGEVGVTHNGGRSKVWRRVVA
jgi:hypothetical protein